MFVLLVHLGLMALSPPSSSAPHVDAHHSLMIEQCDASSHHSILTGLRSALCQLDLATVAPAIAPVATQFESLLDSGAPAPDPTKTRVAHQHFLN